MRVSSCGSTTAVDGLLPGLRGGGASGARGKVQTANRTQRNEKERCLQEFKYHHRGKPSPKTNPLARVMFVLASKSNSREAIVHGPGDLVVEVSRTVLRPVVRRRDGGRDETRFA